MLKIIVNINRQDVVISYTLGQSLPTIEGKLISIEANGKELLKLQEALDIPFNVGDNVYITWHGRNAGRALRALRELLSK